MKNRLKFFLLTLCLPALLTTLPSCATTSSDPRGERFLAELSARGVPADTMAKIEAGRVLQFEDVRNLVKSEVPGSQIVAYLQSTRAHYSFSQNQIRQLVRAGADSTLVNYLGRTRGDFLIDAQNAAAQDRLLRNQQINEEFWDHPYFADPFFDGMAPFDYGYPLIW